MCSQNTALQVPPHAIVNSFTAEHFITQPDNVLLVAGVADNRAAELLVEVCWHGEINSDAPAHPTITAARRREEINSLSAF